MDKCLTYSKANVTLFFPEGKVCCMYCPLMETYARKQCRRTGEYLTDERGRGMFCPLEVEDDNGI